MMHARSSLSALSLLITACGSAGTGGDSAVRSEVLSYLGQYEAAYQRLATEAQEAEWVTRTHIVPGDDGPERRLRAAQEQLAAFTGSVMNIELSRAYLKRRRELPPLLVKQLEAVLFKAGANPQTVPDLVKERIAAETEQARILDSFAFELEGRPVNANEIDAILRQETDLTQRLAAWEASKAVGPQLRTGLIKLRTLRNESVRALGYRDFFAYKASEYGLGTAELTAKVEQIQRELRPLFIELHTWMRHELAARYAQPVPDLIPAHWLPNRWGQDWSAAVSVPGHDLGAALAQHTPEWVVKQAERFYVSIGFEQLPQSFWDRSSLYPAPPGADWQKNSHASAWHVDLDRDVRCLMSVVPDEDWFETAHHELGHIYYYLAYARPEVPLLLREGANRAFHEAIGSLMGLAALQPRCASSAGLAAAGEAPDPVQLLLKQALTYVVFLPWSAGTMFHFERELYADSLPSERWNQRWWQLAAQYQGIAPPTPRDERWCDAATKTHINDDPAEYYDYALSFVLLFQLHDHIARQILYEDPHDTNYYGRKEVGQFLQGLMRPGAGADWRALLRERTSSDLSARAMLDHFEPLRRWLIEQNRGRTPTLTVF